MSKQCAQHSSWFALSHTGWARLRAEGCICGPPGSSCMKASTFLWLLNSPLFHFTESFLTSLCQHWKENQKLSYSHDVPFSSSSRVPSAPLQGTWPAPWVVGYMKPRYSSHSYFLPLVSTSFPSLTSNLFFQLMKTWTKAFPHLQLFPG